MAHCKAATGRTFQAYDERSISDTRSLIRRYRGRSASRRRARISNTSSGRATRSTRRSATRGFIATIAAIAERVSDALAAGHKLLLAGNGGSAADAQHLAGEFLSRLNYDRAPVGGDGADHRQLGADRDRQRLRI